MNKLLFVMGTAMICCQLHAVPYACNVIHPSATQITETNDKDKTLIRLSLSGMDAQDSILVRTEKANDTIVAKNGVVEYQRESNHVEMVNFYRMSKYLGNGRYTPFKMKPITVITSPESQLQVTGDFDCYKVTGNKFYTKYNQMNAPIEAGNARKKELSNQFIELRKTNKATEEDIKRIQDEFNNISKESNKYVVDYVANHLDDELSVFLLYYFHPTAGEAYIDKIDTAIQNGEMSHFYKKAHDFYTKMAAKRVAAEKVQEGKPAPAFTLKDINGKDFSLTSLKGKYVVLDFWGSWCGWCIKGIPEMKKMYEKYQGKLEIVGIDCNDPEPKWKAAVAKHELKWVNVINNPKGGTDMTAKYNISGFPTKVIISPEGRIVKTIVGEDPAFYETIDQLMK